MKFSQWQQLAQSIRARADRIQNMRTDRLFKLGATVGLPRDITCVHNASIDDNLSGWCFQNPERLAIAKRINYEMNQWEASKLADRVISRALKSVQY